MTRMDVARAIACFEQSEDTSFLRDVLRTIRPRAESAARRFEQQQKTVPPPETIEPAPEPASPDEAFRTVRSTKDFALLQAMSRAAGRRVEELAASG